MHPYEELEQRYYRKRRKKFIFIFLFIVSIAILLGFLSFFLLNSKKSDDKKSKKIVQHKTIIKKDKKIVIKNNKKLVLNPIFPKIELSKDNEKNSSKKVEKLINSSNKKEKSKSIKKDNKEVNKKELKEENINEKPIKINIETKVAKLPDLINSYDNLPDYNVAMQIANIYFNKKKYKKSLEWVKKANILKPDDYKNWLLYAKNLVKLGKISKAKEILIIYTKTYGNNENIDNYLRSIK